MEIERSADVVISSNGNPHREEPEGEPSSEGQTSGKGEHVYICEQSCSVPEVVTSEGGKREGGPENSIEVSNGNGDFDVSNSSSVLNDEEVTTSSKTFSDSESDEPSDSRYKEEVPAKKRKKSTSELSNGIRAIQHHQTLKKTMATFIQHKSCEKLKYAVGKCLECKISRSQSGRKEKDKVCRFVSFRKLRYTERGNVTVSGFPDSLTDYTEDDMKVWMPNEAVQGMDLELARFLLEEVGDHFCELVNQEKDALQFISTQESKLIIWRKQLLGLREMCDVCSTTLFNYHWTCGKCGFVVCVSCFKTRKNSDGTLPPNPSADENKDELGWLKCHLKGEHKIEQLMLTQIVAGTALDVLFKKMHDLRRDLKIPQRCNCATALGQSVEGDLVTTVCVDVAENVNGKDSVKADGTLDKKPVDDESDDSDADEMHDSLLDLMEMDNPEEGEADKAEDTEDPIQNNQAGVNNIIGDSHLDRQTDTTSPTTTTVVLDRDGQTESENKPKEIELTNFIRQGGQGSYSRKVIAKKLLTLTESNLLYPTTPHTWLCNGYLLRLLEPTNPGNLKMFREQWKRGQPVIVSNVSGKLTTHLWTPESFSMDFGHKTSNLINCMTGKVLPSQKMKKFWDGFEHMKHRLKDDNGVPMLLKLKDWPPGHDFAEVLPTRFKDLMNALPLGEYTHRDGKLNLAARLPDLFSKPDLGPKMYIAYGSGLHLDKGTTNLHLDMSDAVNVMVHVGVVKDEDPTEHINAVMKAIEESDCDLPTINRVRKHGELPGALWHIWEAKDADKIRDMLNKVAMEHGRKIERHHDAIHDQSWYLDRELRKRLRKDYNVSGYPIVQCAGDAVFIPAGAPHQVRNLHNCIKIAEDFVSPENVGHCFHLTEEFRNLTETHTNHEDKLQVKNIVYHTIKDAVGVVESSVKN